MKRIVSFFLICSLMLLVSCGSFDITPTEGAITFTDDMGKTISVSSPSRVAVLFSSFADIWNLAGGSIHITVGEAVSRGFADENALLVDDGAGKKINTELLLSYAPDFILYSADIPAQAEAAEFVSQTMGIPTAGFRVETVYDYLRVLKICTDITGSMDAYETYGECVLQEIESLLADIPDGNEKKDPFHSRGRNGGKGKNRRGAFRLCHAE